MIKHGDYPMSYDIKFGDKSYLSTTETWSWNTDTDNEAVENMSRVSKAKGWGIENMLKLCNAFIRCEIYDTYM